MNKAPSVIISAAAVQCCREEANGDEVGATHHRLLTATSTRTRCAAASSRATWTRVPALVARSGSAAYAVR